MSESSGYARLRALSLWQPWATLVAIGHKRIETRSWATSYRGPVLICSTAKTPGDVFRKATTDPRIYERMKGAAIGYPHGVALCVVELLGCERAEDWIASEEAADRHEHAAREKVLGDLSPGRFAWRLGATRTLWSWPPREMLEPVIDVKGRQGLWTAPAGLLEIVNNQLARIEEAVR